MRGRVIATALLAVGFAAVPATATATRPSPSASEAATSGISGKVTVVPKCPAGSASECARPASLPVIVLKGGLVVKTLRSKANGSFRVIVAPGKYVVLALSTGKTLHAVARVVVVRLRKFSFVTLAVRLT